ncbi:MAG: four helix bundle protein [Candidatus Moranbacteria bacterium CG_4_9_14_3_um_filter_40_7]|nr:MAG: four helix bundle protein [Candidatus Moranbacteria bacterium CG23_combo_of_CG06-09_8_20_14_all_40_16]PIU80641.1 MAG: four helix bundle protein [Candidatus Moranbacteria bacterium CG06_land_8_20_14_3_00_40_12]PJA87883.1 MAG: four helix bundle protein [Candidatus Moranbacteria bacterium CG_4_9_14_3_um_filter_40_7]
MTNQIPNPNDKIFKLEERTAVFGEEVIKFVKGVKQDNVNKPIISQLVRSTTSVGANYCEADGAESKKDFQHKISICKKECKETKHWLRMLAVTNPESAERCRVLWKEAHELTLIFSKIINNSKINK